MYKNKGFTLIELLMVVAIIGILSAIVYSSLNDARKKGSDAGVKSNLTSARSQAEVVYNTRTANPLSYTGVCTNGVVDGAQGIGLIVLTAAKAVGLSSYAIGAASSPTQAVCNASASAWAAEVPLKQGGYWCADSTNISKYFATAKITSGTDYSCN